MERINGTPADQPEEPSKGQGVETTYLKQLKVTHRAHARGNEVATAISEGVADVV